MIDWLNQIHSNAVSSAGPIYEHHLWLYVDPVTGEQVDADEMGKRYLAYAEQAKRWSYRARRLWIRLTTGIWEPNSTDWYLMACNVRR